MLSIFRGKSGNLAAKIILFVLILSFAAWGLADYVNRSSNPYMASVASVGKYDITGNQLVQTVDRQLRQISAQFGKPFPLSAAPRFGLVNRSLQELINQELLEQETTRLGLTISNDKAIELVTGLSMFQDDQGNFDTETFKRFLSANRLSEGQYLNNIKQTTAQRQLLRPLFQGPTPPAKLANMLSIFENQTRTVAALKIPLSKFSNIGEPSEQEIVDTYEANKARFASPEYRAFSYITLDLQSALKNAPTPSDEAVKSYYEQNLETLRTPETRSYKQVVVGDDATAQDVFEASEVAGQLTPAEDASVSTLDGMTSEDTLPALSNSVFSAREGEILPPIQSDFGWHVIQLTNVTPATTPSFEAVKPQLTKQLKEESAVESFYEEVGEIEGALSDQNDLATVAEMYQLPLTKVKMVSFDGEYADKSAGKSSGKTSEKTSGKSSGASPDQQLLELAYQLPVAGETSPFAESENGQLRAVQVTEIQESAPAPLEKVRSKVISIWRETQKFRKAQDLAATIQPTLKSTASVASAAGKYSGVQQLSSQTFGRFDSAEGPYNRDIIQQIFATPAGSSFQSNLQDGVIVVYMADIELPQSAEDTAADSLELKQQLGGELFGAYMAALQNRMGVTVSEPIIQKLFAPTAPE